MNFKVVDGDTLSNEEYETLKAEYLDTNIRVVEILKRHGLTATVWAGIRKRITEETGFIRSQQRKPEKRKVSNISFHRSNGRYCVHKGKNNKTISYGYYYSYEDARKVRDELLKVDWDKSELPRIKRGLGL